MLKRSSKTAAELAELAANERATLDAMKDAPTANRDERLRLAKR